MKELKDLQVGDEVIVRRRFSKKVATVEKVTATQILVKGVRYYKKNGREVGGDTWTSRYISIPKEGEIAKVREDTIRKEIEYFFNGTGIDSLSFNKVQQIYNIIKSE